MKRILIENAVIVNEGRKVPGSVVIEGEKIAEILVNGQTVAMPCDETIDASGCYLLPGAIDEHVHFRDPGLTHKADITTESHAAAAGGVTSIMDMPNTNPQTTTLEALDEKLALLAEKSSVNFSCYFGATNNNYPLFSQLNKSRVCGVKLFMGSSTGNMLVDRMASLRNIFGGTDLLIAAHCEDLTLRNGGYIHDGDYAKRHGHKGISSESEWKPIQRDLKLAEETGCKYHVCHISTKESVEIIAEAKARGVDVTCETAPHYLIFKDEDLQEDGRFKMNPPIRSEKDREALRKGILDGTIDMIATDHAPHSEEEKAKGLAGSAMGIVGLETAFPVLYTELVKSGILPLERLVELMAEAPRRRFGLPSAEEADDWAVWNIAESYTICPENFISMGRATPFARQEVYGKCVLNLLGGKTVWEEKK